MEYTLRPFARLDDRSLEAVALLHQSVMHNLLTDLGLPIISRYYQIARSEPSVVGFCAVSASGEILGWVVGSPDPYTINALLQTPRSWFFRHVMVLAVRRPRVFLQILVSVFHSSRQRLHPQVVELTYLGVAPQAQNRGVGRALLQAFTEAGRRLDYRSIELTTETDNLHALGLYERSGFAVKRNFKEGRFERYRMECRLRA